MKFKRLFYYLSLLLLTACQQQGKTPVRPNIIVITADDLGFSDLGCYGSEISTPNLDKLANQGMRFTRFHNTSKCFPSRASLITGVYPQDCDNAARSAKAIKNAVFIGEVLRTAAYKTYWSGKHHGPQNPYERGFDHYYGLRDGACNYFNPGTKRENEVDPAHKRVRHWCIDSITYHPYTPVEKDFYTTDYFTNYALNYIEEAAQDDAPFFLYVAYNAPHDPLMAWPEDIKKYRGKYDEGYEKTRLERYHKQQALGLIDESFALSTSTYTPWQELSKEERSFESRKMEVYAAMIDRMDQNIGRLLTKLTQKGMMDHTIILFASDNGASHEVVNLKTDNDNASIGGMERWVSLGPNWANVCNTPFRYSKTYSYEGGINTPFIAWWPNHIAPASKTQFTGHFIDIMPTLIELTGGYYPEEYKGEHITPLRGMSLLPVFNGEDIKRPTPLYWQWNKGKALYYEGWKIVKHSPNTKWDLYHLENDPTETKNLSQDRPEKVEALNQLFEEWQSQYN